MFSPIKGVGVVEKLCPSSGLKSLGRHTHRLFRSQVSLCRVTPESLCSGSVSQDIFSLSFSLALENPGIHVQLANCADVTKSKVQGSLFFLGWFHITGLTRANTEFLPPVTRYHWFFYIYLFISYNRFFKMTWGQILYKRCSVFQHFFLAITFWCPILFLPCTAEVLQLWYFLLGRYQSRCPATLLHREAAEMPLSQL